MSKNNDHKQVERKARQLLIDKDIPRAKMDVVQSLINNKDLVPHERFSAIIELIQNCPDKISKRPQSTRRELKNKGETQTVAIQENPVGPTETSYYIDNLFHKYKHLKLFKKRYLVHRNNRIGIGFRKRLIPTKKLLKLFQELGAYQETIMSRLTQISMDILEDESCTDPVVFNYLRLLRKWMLDEPLVRYTFDFIKWLENHNFEREFRNYIFNLISFNKLPLETREKIVLQCEIRLRQLPDLKKADITSVDNDQTKRIKEKENLEKEKKIYEYMLTLRAYISPPEDNNVLSRFLLHNYKIPDVNTLFNIICETLIFQKPVSTEELIKYFNIVQPSIDTHNWDYSKDYLKKYGKDPQTQQDKKISLLRKKLYKYEVIYRMLKLDDNGHNLLFKSVEEQWRHVDKRKQDPEDVFDDNFFNFLDGLINYFKNTYTPFLDGTEITFLNNKNERIEGRIFSANYFKTELGKLHSIINDMHFFKTNNPTLAINRQEAYRILKGKIKTMVHVERFIKLLGSFFFTIAQELQHVYDSHVRWLQQNKKHLNENELYSPLTQKSDTAHDTAPRPVPFYNCTIKGFQNSTSLSKLLSGKVVIADSLYEGCLVDMIAFAYQAALECKNENITALLNQRKKIIDQIDTLLHNQQ